MLIGGRRSFRGQGQIDVAQFQPAGRGIAVATGLVVAIAALALLLVVLLGR